MSGADREDRKAAIAAMPSRTSSGRFGPQSRHDVGPFGAMLRRTQPAMRDAFRNLYAKTVHVPG